MPNITKPSGMSSIWASAGVATAPAGLKISQGWVVELPPYQTANFIENKQDQFNGHVNMHGLPVWDSETEYQGGVSYTKGSNGTVYKCLATNINFDPTNPLNSNYWTTAFEPFGSVAVVAANLATLQSNYNTLSGIVSLPTARNNLSVFSKSESDTRYAFKAGTSTQVFAIAAATQPEHAIRLDQVPVLVPQATESVKGIAELASTLETEAGVNDLNMVTPLKGAQTYLKKSDNLSTLSSAATARTNLGLGSIAVEAAASFLRATNNFSDVASVAVARSNLGLTSTATQPETYFLRAANNLSDLVSVPTARTNLGLGGAALLNVGTTIGTVAAGDDTRIVNAVQTTRTITAGNGLTGGGNLTSDRTITLGLPSTINVASTNNVSAESHSHALDITSFFGDRLLADSGYYTLPGGLLVQWGSTFVNGDSQVAVTLQKPYTTFYKLIPSIGFAQVEFDNSNSVQWKSKTLTGFTLKNQWSGASQPNHGGTVDWITVGV